MTEAHDHRCYDQLFIGGHWREPSTGQRLTVISPHSEKPDRRRSRRSSRGRRRRGRRCATRLRPRTVAPTGPARTHAQGRRARDDLFRPPRRDGRSDHRRDGIAAQLQPAGPGRGGGVDDASHPGRRPRLSLGRAPPRRARRSTPAPRPGRRGRSDRAVERAAVLDHAQADSRPDRGLHGHRQARARNTFGRFVVGRNDRAAGPARRGGVRTSRRHGCRRGAGAPSRCGQDLVHRVECGRTPDRRAVRRATQAGEPGTRRQVGGDHSRRRRHRQDGQGD